MQLLARGKGMQLLRDLCLEMRQIVPDFGDALHRRQHVATFPVHVLYTLGSGLHIARHDFLHTSGYPFRLPEDSLIGVVG